MAIRFEWDPDKDKANQRKHGVSFAVAARAFYDPLALSFPDRNVDGEEQWRTIGNAEGLVILTIASTLRPTDNDEVIRIISARKATPSERKLNEEAY